MAASVAFAVAAHPDDIELMMAGTLLLLGEAGYELHVMNVANGCCGSMREDPVQTATRRTEEAEASARVLNATFHRPIANDLEIFYEDGLLRKLAAIVREVTPTILLLQSPEDYMEDHMNASRLGVTAAFTRGMPNYVTTPPISPTMQDVTVYHCLPWGLRGPLGRRIHATRFVNIERTLGRKREALACHASQKEWLDATQGIDSYLTAMEETSREIGRMSGRFSVAEGWRRHSHLGLCAPDADPLVDALGELVYTTTDEE